jgi:hypothetical protein
MFREQAVAVDDGGGDVDELAVGRAGVLAQHFEGACFVDGMAFHEDALGTLGEGTSPKAPSRSWYSAKRRSTMSIELCQSSTSVSLMWANTPRLDASLMKEGSGVCSKTITGQAASRTVLSISPSAWSELSPSPTSATSGRSRGHGSDLCDVDLTHNYLVSQGRDDRRDQSQRSLRSLAISTRRC